MKMYESRFLAVYFFPEEKIHENVWLPASEEMEEHNYQEESLNFLEILLKNQPEKFIADTREMNFGITPDLQAWTNEHILSKALSSNLKKVAFLISKEMITQLSIEQTMEESEEAALRTRYFDNREAAWQWLTS